LFIGSRMRLLTAENLFDAGVLGVNINYKIPPTA
jgi:hypothetical protein